MYDINFSRIHSQANYLSTCINVLEEVGIPTTKVEQFAVMRSFHIGVECVIDIGNTIIDGFIMRDPGGYADIIDILEDERVIPTILANKLKDFVKLREQLVRYYDQLDESELTRYIEETAVFREFQEHVEAFIKKEKASGNVYV